ncbi:MULTISPECIES: UDP-2,3-diacylglucosamine diphosphatase LpxI [Rhodomicrobium]|uniref:LpxI family protein n=1 Tax=Rhodomicrobium TaxID=1068 RepID=UPI000B4BFF4A|nr:MULTISPECIES: UDP-2,3-diacylglucosamine diphosphatase LpxI [Rhodomicrobium]
MPARPLPTRLGIVAAAGSIPVAVCEAALAKGIEVQVVALKGQASADIARFPHRWVRLGELGGLLGALREARCAELVIVGSLRRPDLRKVGVDFGLIRHLPTILTLTRGGDDTVLKRVVRFFEAQGFTVRGAHEIAPALLAPKGPCGGLAPGDEDERDIAHGFALLAALGPFDVGQAAVIARGHVLAVEAAEGTDEMLKRCAGLKQWGGHKRAGVLVKAPKQGQELRIDMPVVGPRTVELAAAAGLAGIAVMSGQVMIADQAEMVNLADRHKLFVTGADMTV